LVGADPKQPWTSDETDTFRSVRVGHRDLDLVIARLVSDPQVDQLMLKRLKNANSF
jgi:hypothetical protein